MQIKIPNSPNISKIVKRGKIDLISLAWYMYFNKTCRVKLVLWCQTSDKSHVKIITNNVFWSHILQWPEEGQTIQWPEEDKGQKYKQRSTKHYTEN
jgi:hypothetical protein